MNDQPEQYSTRLRTFGRRQGHKLKPRQQALMDRLFPKLNVDPQDPALNSDPKSLFEDRIDEIWFEVGFGGGEHAAWQVAHHPQVGLIGCEPFLNGMASFLSHVEDQNLSARARVFHDDARTLLDRLPDRSIDRLFLLFPDPWRKKRHFKRRFVGPENLKLVARVLKPGGEFRIGSDHMPYIDWSLFHMQNHPDFKWICDGPSDWRTRPEDWPQTRYEKKALKQGKKCVYLRFIRT